MRQTIWVMPCCRAAVYWVYLVFIPHSAIRTRKISPSPRHRVSPSPLLFLPASPFHAFSLSIFSHSAIRTPQSRSFFFPASPHHPITLSPHLRFPVSLLAPELLLRFFDPDSDLCLSQVWVDLSELKHLFVKSVRVFTSEIRD